MVIWTAGLPDVCHMCTTLNLRKDLVGDNHKEVARF